MAKKTIKGHRVYKDGTIETSGEREARHIRNGMIQGISGALLVAGGLASMFNSMAHDPMLYLPLTQRIANPEMARIAATVIESVGGGIVALGGGALLWLAHQTKQAERRARETVASYGLHYRPGDNAKRDAELREAAIARGEFVPDLPARKGRAPS